MPVYLVKLPIREPEQLPQRVEHGVEEEVEPGQPDKVIGDGQLEESLHHRHHLLVGEGQQGVDRGGDDPLLDQGQHQLGADRHLQQPAEQEAEELFIWSD